MYLTGSVQFSRSVVSDSLRPHELQHARPPCPSPTPSVHPNSCPSSWWCHPAISSSVVPFSSRPQSFLASGSSQMSHLFTSVSQSFSFNISPSNEYSGLISFRKDWSDLLAVQGTLKSFLQHHNSKASILWCLAFFIAQHDYWKNHQIRSDQSLSHVQLFATAWMAAHQASLSITNSQSPPKPISIKSVMPSNHLILCRPLLLLTSIFPSISVF